MPGQWAVPDCPQVNTNHYPSPPAWGQKPPPPDPHAHHKPTQPPAVDDAIEIHYVYSWEENSVPGTPAPQECERLKSQALTNELSHCSPPLVVIAVWARVTGGPPTNPQNKSPLSPFGGTEYPGSTTGAGRPTQKAYWRLNAGCREVSLNDLDPDGTAAGKIKGHPSRPLQPVR